jgi:hypothetical protein
MKIRLHMNKHGIKKGTPWTLHTSKGCFPAAHVEIHVPCATEENPKRRSNPRYFIVMHGEISWEEETAVIR